MLYLGFFVYAEIITRLVTKVQMFLILQIYFEFLFLRVVLKQEFYMLIANLIKFNM